MSKILLCNLTSGLHSLFDTDSGEVENVSGAKGTECVGNLDIIDGKVVALYCENGCHLRIGNQSWNFCSSDIELKYFHDENRVTNFTVSTEGKEFHFTYQCWWAESETEDFRLFPELDEENDFLGYAIEVWRNPSLKGRLVDKWKAVWERQNMP